MEKHFLSLLFLAIVSSQVLAQHEQNRLPIIDVHMHAYAKDERWNQKIPNPLSGQAMTATTEEAHMRATLAEMKKYNIVKAVVSNDYNAVLRWKTAAPDRIIASYGFDDPGSADLDFLRLDEFQAKENHKTRRRRAYTEIR